MPVAGMTTYTSFLILFAVLMLLMFAAGIVGVVFYIKWNNQNTREEVKRQTHTEFESFRKEVIKINNGVVESVVAAFHDGEIHRNAQKELINTFTRLGKVIKDDLYNIMNKVNASRAAIYLYHNGTRSPHGLSFLKLSCIGERTYVGSGIKEQIINHSNMPINLFDDMTEKLMNNGRYVIMNDEETMNSAKSQFISAPKVKYSQAISVYDASNNILGFILVEFQHSYNKITADGEYEIVKGLASKISPILSFTEYAELALNPGFSNAITPN